MSHITHADFLAMTQRIDAAKKRKLNPEIGEAVSCGESEGEKVSREIEQLHRPALRYCADRHWYVIYHDPTHRTGCTAGCPDLVIFAENGRVIPIEFKIPGAKLSEDQRNCMHMLKAKNHPAWTVTSLQEFYEIVNAPHVTWHSDESPELPK